MSQVQLGLFDTPPNRKELRLGFAIVGVVIVALVCVLPFRDIRLNEVTAFVPVVDAMMLLGELITATLLYAQSIIFRSRALAVLASGYVFTAFLLVPHALSFPGAFAPDGLLGAGLNSTAWIAFARRFGFPVAVALYALLKPLDSTLQFRSNPKTIAAGATTAMGAAAVATVLTTVGHGLLPPYYVNRTDLIYGQALIYQSAMLAAFLAAAALLFKKRSSVLDLWLLVALTGWVIETVLTLTLHARFTVGWYSLFVLMLFTHLVVMLALLAESSRVYARLAVAAALRQEERDARLMSMESVAAAISHEVGQPVSAANMSASAALNWLTRRKPDVQMAIASLNAAIDSGHRAFDVIRSIRSMFGRGAGPATDFDVNELVTETAALLKEEFVTKKIGLEFLPDEGLPSITADRVLLQRVLLNLFTNAAESIEAAKRKSRQIRVSSKPLNSENLLVEISDSGAGISGDDLPHIFDAFVTTKPTGTGLGLSLCRTIIEEHGGKLWASQNDNRHGATFHLQLPCNSLES